jgi:integral membrane protein
MMKTPIGRLRVTGLIEGVSYLVLLGIAMPLKYLAGMPMAVKVVGWIHGGLFVLFCLALAHVWLSAGWSIWRAAGVFIASLIPFGTFAIDGRLKREDEARRTAPTSPA